MFHKRYFFAIFIVAGTDPELQCSPKILNPDNMNTSGSSSSQSAHSNVEDISVIPAIVNTSTSIDSNREISSYDAQESFDEDMDSGMRQSCIFI